MLFRLAGLGLSVYYVANILRLPRLLVKNAEIPRYLKGSSDGSVQCHVVIGLFLFVLSPEYVFVLSDIGDHGHPFA